MRYFVWGKRVIILLVLSVLGMAECRSQSVDSTLYAESSITLTSSGKISGTLCIPTKVAHYPVALIIAGSGPTDRDGNSMGGLNTDAYKILAHRLAANGLASVRYDKRGIGESRGAMTSESDLTFETYIDDARQWIDTLKKFGRFTKVIVIGHSEGSLIGMVAAAKDAGAYISISGAGSRIGIVLKRQLESIPEPLRDTAYSIIDSLAQGHLVSYVPMRLRMIFRASVQPYMISWLKYDPQAEIQKLRIPILIIQGTNDIQVDTNDAKLLEAANPKARLVLITNMNHLFRIVTGGREDNIKTYSEPELPISDQLVYDIVNFIEAQ